MVICFHGTPYLGTFCAVLPGYIGLFFYHLQTMNIITSFLLKHVLSQMKQSYTIFSFFLVNQLLLPRCGPGSFIDCGTLVPRFKVKMGLKTFWLHLKQKRNLLLNKIQGHVKSNLHHNYLDCHLFMLRTFSEKYLLRNKFS